MRVVIKVGGALIAKNFENVVEDISNIYLKLSDKYELVVVHGGGPQINEILRSMNKEPKYFKTPSGYTTRYTDQEAISAAIMSLGGLNNKRLVEALQKRGVNAFGFTGIDGGTIDAVRKDKIVVLVNNKKLIKRGEYSGKVNSINPQIIKFLLKNKYIPVIGALARSEEGDIVNVDGDRAASQVAGSLDADVLISLTDVEGIYRNFEDKNSMIKSISRIQLEELIERLEGGMKKKAYAALESFKNGVKKVIICSGLIDSPILNALEENGGTSVHDA
ncbi:MAG: [LysW]-aminoadipate kinase [Candidatus Lokiarchaeota archaeon]|nr:[LysW]-aminoadipate kinase [Candidatus Lokiarchaeota archaeon]